MPAGKLDKWNKATKSKADTICIDLEDSVPPAEKNEARSAVFEFLEKGLPKSNRLIIRINSPEIEEGSDDLEMILQLTNYIHGLMIPKIDSGDTLKRVTNKFAANGKTIPLFPLLETARALENGFDILNRNNVKGAVFGGHDLAMQLGCSKEWDVLSAYRSAFVRSAGGLNLCLIDMPWFGLDDKEGLRSETVNAKRFGFTAKAAIHPKQVKTINTVFTPTKQEVDEAKEMISVFEKSEGHAVAWKDKVLEPPVINQAKRIIERAGKTGLH